MPSLIGNKPNQVPTNGDLGTLAFQDANAVNINGGTIDGATIGGTAAAAGNFTTLGATGRASFSAGTVSAPSITTTGDVNTGIFFPAADTIAFTEGGTERMRIDSAGNVGIGISSPASKLQVSGAGTQEILVTNTSTGSLSLRHATTIATVGTVNNIPLKFETNNTERMHIDTSGNVGIGTSSPQSKMQVSSGANPYVVQNSGRAVYGIDIQATAGGSGAFGGAISFGNGGSGRSAISAVQGTADADTAGLSFFVHTSSLAAADAVEAMRIDSSGSLLFNSGYGSVATAYGCRAWVNYDGSADSVRASGNVSSVTRSATGVFTVNFSTAMPDTNYCVVSGYGQSLQRTVSLFRTSVGDSDRVDPTTTSFRVVVAQDTSSGTNPDDLHLAVFR